MTRIVKRERKGVESVHVLDGGDVEEARGEGRGGVISSDNRTK